MTEPGELRIFAKGNTDLRDALLWSRVDGKLEWNGLNEALREAGHPTRARVRHETAVGFDFIPLRGAAPDAPAELLARFPAKSAHPLARQQATSLFAQPQDVVVLSLQPEVMNTRARHRRSGFAFLAEEALWEPEHRGFLSQECESVGRVGVEASMRALEALLDEIDAKLAAHVLVFNLCPVLPGERVHSYLGAGDALALRVARFNLALAELSSRRDLSIVDVQRVSACAGAERVKLDLVHFNGEGLRLIAHEVVRVLEARGLLEGERA